MTGLSRIFILPPLTVRERGCALWVAFSMCRLEYLGLIFLECQLVIFQ